MSGRGRYTPRQWFAIKNKLKRSGKFDESRAKKKPVQSNTLDNYKHQEEAQFEEVTDPTTIAEVNEIANTFEAESGKQLMSNYGGPEQDCDIFSEDSTVSSSSEQGRISETDLPDNTNELEGQNLQTDEELSNSPVSVLHERRDIPRETWEIERAFRDIEISPRTRDRIRVAGIPETSGTVRDQTLIIFRVGSPVFWVDWKEDKTAYNRDLLDIDNYSSYEAYFQTFNSLAVVIRCLPDEYITTCDIFRKLVESIDDPFVIVCEKSEEGVLHWHMIWLTSKRSDNAKRLLQKYLVNLEGNISVAVQQTRSFKHLIKYILKNPITIGVANSDALSKYVFAIQNELTDLPIKPKDKDVNLSDFPNAMVKDLIEAMNATKKYTLQELVFYAPATMKKHLHKPNLESIIHNCKMFLHRPNDTLLTMERVTSDPEFVFTDIFPLWYWLEYQGCNAGNFILDFWNVIFKLSDKRNVLSLKGPSNCGKTYFIRPLADIFNWGEIVQGGQFMFQNCINKELLFWEEPLIGSDYADMCKRVFEGMTTQVNVKFKAAQTLYRTPIIITTNKDVAYYCESESDAFANRMCLYLFNKNAVTIAPFSSAGIRKSWKRYSEWLTVLSQYFTGCEPHCTGGPEYSAAENASNKCSFHRELYFSSGVSDGIPDSRYTSDVGGDSGEFNNGRRSRSPSPSEQRTKRTRPAVNDSTPADPSECRAGTSTRDPTRPRSQSEHGFTLYSPELTGHRRDHRLGGQSKLIGGYPIGRCIDDSRGNLKCHKLLQENCLCLLSFGRRYKSLKKIFQETELSVQPGVDRSFYDSSLRQPSTKNQWISLILLGLNCCKSDSLL